MSGRKEARGRGGRGGAKGAPFLLGGLNADADSEDEGSLEAELFALTGGQPTTGKQKPKGKEPLPMEHIERMAALCMKDLDDDDVDDLEDDDDEDLLAELDDVLADEKEAPKIIAPVPQTAPSTAGSMESTLSERLTMYKEALTNAKQAGEGSKVRRYERGVKTLEDLICSVKKGKSVSPDDIPPPVAVGKSSDTPAHIPAAPLPPHPPTQSMPVAAVNGEDPRVPSPIKTPPAVPVKPQSLPRAVASLAPVTSSPAILSQEQDGDRTRVLERQREYKLAALHSKHQGDSEMASKYYRIAKSLDPVLSALDSGERLDASSLPPPPDQSSLKQLEPSQPCVKAVTPTAVVQTLTSVAVTPTADPPSPPKDTLDALQQRMERYRSASEQAKSKGDDRKARMHDRIVKQYQDAIRSHKAGKPVNLAELPIPPGFPPIHGTEPSHQEQSIVGVLETAMKLANQQDGGESDDDDEKPVNTLKVPSHSAPALQPQPTAPKVSPAKSPKASGKAQQQLQFLEGRRKQLMAAALRSKQHRDLEGAKIFLRQAKGLDPMIEASRAGMPVDITKVPAAPVNEDDFNLDQHRKGGGPAANSEKYNNLMEILKQQHEMCMSYSQQFTHLGNITETAKYEKLGEECMKYINLVKLAHSRGLPVPRCHYEERTVSIVKLFPELSSSDLVLYVTRCVNLPVPSGSSASDMDTFVRFEFAYPSLEEAQKDKTNVIKSTNSPVFKEKFTLQINRNHRGLKRAIQAKGIKFEVVMKGHLFKADRLLGTSQLKLESLEANCEIREILEVMDGRRPSGGKLDVAVKIREPFTSQQLSSNTEKWLVIDPITLPPVSVAKPKPPIKSASKSPPPLHSLSVLSYEKEKLEKKIHMFKQQHRAIPDDLIGQLNDVTQRSQQQIQMLRQGEGSIRTEYVRQLERYLQFYGDSARRLGQEGNREAAKEALYKRNLVSNELQKLNR